MNTLGRVVLAIVVGILVFLACIFIGGVILASIQISWVSATGEFLKQWASLFGLLAALWHFFKGNGWPLNRA